MRIVDVRQETSRLTWRSTLFELRSNAAAPVKIGLIDPVPQPSVVREASWDEWDDAVLHQDRRMGVLS